MIDLSSIWGKEINDMRAVHIVGSKIWRQKQDEKDQQKTVSTRKKVK